MSSFENNTELSKKVFAEALATGLFMVGARTD